MGVKRVWVWPRERERERDQNLLLWSLSAEFVKTPSSEFFLVNNFLKTN